MTTDQSGSSNEKNNKWNVVLECIQENIMKRLSGSYINKWYFLTGA